MRHVKVILREDVPNVGDAGEVVTVRTGFARNFLIPQGKAIAATASNVHGLEHQKRVIAERVARELKVLDGERAKLEGVVVEIAAQAGEEGRLFGSVTSAQIAEQLAERGLEVDRRRIALDEPIKELGERDVTVRLHRQISATIKVRVVAAS